LHGERTIRFLLDGEIHTVANVAPTTTVLDYLRERLRRCGTKEGCAEGDCGACTVVLAEIAGSGLRYRAVNACIRFLPTLDGKALFTVESLKGADGGLHPVQRAMVECHGSQCGFCTPGFVMSLYALYRSNRQPGDAAILQALSGNLCRCTGYRPILAAARRMGEYPDDGHAAREHELRERLLAIRPTGEKRLSAAGQTWVAPATAAGLAQALASRPDATILAGGTDVGLWVTKQHRDLPEIVYVGNVAELAGIDASDGALEIGAAVSLTDAFEALLAEYPELQEIARRFASPPICNAGTLGGNVANGSPIGDTMPALISLGAEVVLQSADGRRTVALEDFYLDYMKKDLRPGEFVAAVRVPRARAGRLFRSYKIAKRFDQDISAVCGAFAIDLADGRVRSARVCYGGMAAIPRRAPACEQALAGADWSAAGVGPAIAALANDYEPISDCRATRGYRRQVAANLLLRCVAETTSPAGAVSVWQHAG
jgi:xanthine dehydrogenase small subunit